MRKLKAGDVVIVQPKVDVELLRHVSPGFTKEMDRMLGKQGKVVGTGEYISISGCHYSFRPEWLKLLTNEVTVFEED